MRRAGYLGLGFCILLTLGIVGLALATEVVHNKFNGHVGLLICLIVALFTFGVEFLARGAFAGMGRFGAYGVSLAAEGVIRFLPCVPLALAGVTNPFWYGLLLAVPPLLATMVAMRGQHGLALPGPTAPWSELSSNLGYLLGGSMLAQVLSYAPFIGAQVLAKPGERAAVADFAVGLFLSRIPILLVPGGAGRVAAEALDARQRGPRRRLPARRAAARAHRRRDRRARCDRRRPIGPFAGRILFGDKFNLSNSDVALLALGSGLFILALTLSQALISLHGHQQAMVAWFLGHRRVRRDARGSQAHELFLRVELGSIAGAGVAAAAMGLFFLRRLSRGVEAGSLASLVEQIEYGTLEI